MSKEVSIKRRMTLKQKLDKIDEGISGIIYGGYYQSRLAIEMSMWEKGRLVHEDVKYRGVNFTYYQLEKDAGRPRPSLKKWHMIYQKTPRRADYLLIAQEKAHKWTEKTLAGAVVDKLTGNMENYTPKDIIDKVRAVLGQIDLDPASCEIAQKIVKAKKYYTQENNGLDKPWRGRVFLNPPYGMPDIRNFTDKLISELPNIKTAILLTNDQTDTAWWHKCAGAATYLCLPSGRLRFYTPDKEETSPTNGQTFFYYGKNSEVFCETFSELGLIVRVIA